jgi:hypothetical protein
MHEKVKVTLEISRNVSDGNWYVTEVVVNGRIDPIGSFPDEQKHEIIKKAMLAFRSNLHTALFGGRRTFSLTSCYNNNPNF